MWPSHRSPTGSGRISLPGSSSRVPNGARLDSIRLTRQGSWQVRVHGPFEVRLPNLADTTVEQACYEVADRNARIWAFGIPECVTT